MGLITYEEAVRVIRERIVSLTETESVHLANARGRVLAEPIVAARANPAFDNSAVDGYLLGSPAAEEGGEFVLVGEIRAGSRPPYATPGPGQAVRIFTGAPVPAGAFCVAMQEDVERADDRVRLKEAVGKHAGIRRQGTDFAVGTELAAAGTRIGAAETALAAWNGVSELSVLRPPRVAICVTGDELLEPGQAAEEGQIYDSNGAMLEALVRSASPATVTRSRLGDNFEETKSHLSNLSNDSADLILVSGGASVGDYDHLPAAVAALGEVFFHGVRIKPGKPVLFGRIEKAFVFALPGNPASSYVTFELFVRDALRRLGGEKDPNAFWVPARYDGVHGPANRDEFVRVRFETRDGELWAVPVFEQGSFGIRSLAAADGLARLGADRRFEPGDRCECLLLPR